MNNENENKKERSLEYMVTLLALLLFTLIVFFSLRGCESYPLDMNTTLGKSISYHNALNKRYKVVVTEYNTLTVKETRSTNNG